MNDQLFYDAREIMLTALPLLKRWTTRYAGSDHAKQHVIETIMLRERMQEWLQRIDSSN